MSFVNRSDKETLSNMLRASFGTSATAASPQLTGGSLRWEKAIIHRLPKSKVLLTPFIYYQQPLTLGCAFSTSGFREKGPGRESHVLEVMSSWIMHSKTKLQGHRQELHRTSGKHEKLCTLSLENRLFSMGWVKFSLFFAIFLIISTTPLKYDYTLWKVQCSH